MKLRVAVVTESFPPVFNGVANSVVRILETYKELGYEAIVIAPTVPADTFNGFKTFAVPSVNLFSFQLGLPSAIIPKVLSEFKPDLVHVASPVLLGAQAITWAQRNNIPAVAVFQTDLAGYAERYGFKLFRPRVDKFLANTHSAASLNLAPTTQMRDYLHSLQVKNVEVWGRGVDLELFHPNRKFSSEVQAIRDQLAPNGEKIVGYVGRLAAEKRVDRFAELAHSPNTVFLIVGDGPDRADLEALLPSGKFHFVGKRTSDDLANHYAAMDVFVHFGTEETFGQTIQEAQASGLVVLAPNAGGPKFLVNSGVSGYLIDPEAKGAYYDRLQLVLNSSELANKIAEGGRRSVLNKSWKENNSKLIEFYLKALASHGREFTEQLKVA